MEYLLEGGETNLARVCPSVCMYFVCSMYSGQGEVLVYVDT